MAAAEDRPIKIKFYERRPKRSRTSSSFPFVMLPQGIIHYEILTRLPPKYILRYRLVCKSWYSLFSTSAFINSHLIRQQHSDIDEQDLLILKKSVYGDKVYIVSRTNEFFVKMSCVGGPLLGPINGLICISSIPGNRFCFWNPAIAQIKVFSVPPSHDDLFKDVVKHFPGGFCWDHVQNDYKVLLFCYDSSTSFPSQLLIYSSNSTSWTKLRIPHHCKLFAGPIKATDWKCHPSTIVKGIPYWSYSRYMTLPGKKHSRKIISTFKFVPESNEIRLLPDLDMHRIQKDRFDIVNIKNCIAGIAYTYKDRRGKTLVDIYYLDDEESPTGAWSKMYTVGPIDLNHKSQWLSQCFKNGGEIFIVKRSGPFSFYDPKTKVTKDIKSCDGNHSFGICFNYTPSLVCVQGMEFMQESSTKVDGIGKFHF